MLVVLEVVLGFGCWVDSVNRAGVKLCYMPVGLCHAVSQRYSHMQCDLLVEVRRL